MKDKTKSTKKIKRNQLWLRKQFKSWDRDISAMDRLISDNYDVIGSIDLAPIYSMNSWRKSNINKNDVTLHKKLKKEIDYILDLADSRASWISCWR